VLIAENAALAALDLPAAGALLDEKLAATRALTDAAAWPVRATAEATASVRLVQELAEQNRVLLERAIAVQGRVLDLVARAARQQGVGADGRYAAGGAATIARGTSDRGAVALRVRA